MSQSTSARCFRSGSRQSDGRRSSTSTSCATSLPAGRLGADFPSSPTREPPLSIHRPADRQRRFVRLGPVRSRKRHAGLDDPARADEGSRSGRGPSGSARSDDRRRTEAWRDATGARDSLSVAIGKARFRGRETIEKLYSDGLNLEGVHSPHAWRTSFSTLARDIGEIDRDVIELLLDHVSDSQVIRTYNRAQRFAKRAEAARWWDAQLTGTA